MKTVALIIAGGTGERMHQDIPKQFLTVNEKPVIVYTMEAFQRHPEIDEIAVVCVDGWQEMVKAYARQFNIDKLTIVVKGGDSGQESIRNGVFELEKRLDKNDIVLIHDAIRPMVSAEIISDCVMKTRQYGNAITAIPCQEAMLTTKDGIESEETYPRNNLKRTQTPQGFRIGELCELHREALEKGITGSIASCTLMIELGRKVFFSQGSEKNIKLTTVEDIDIFRALLGCAKAEWMK